MIDSTVFARRAWLYRTLRFRRTAPRYTRKGPLIVFPVSLAALSARAHGAIDGYWSRDAHTPR